MKILVFNGSPRPHGNTAAMVEAFAKGARENGHQVDVVNVCQKKIAGCMACEYCHKEDSGHERQCVQKDDMQEVYPLLDEAEMGRPDDRKLKSSMTLFDAATESLDVFQRILDKYYHGKKDYRTLKMLGIK